MQFSKVLMLGCFTLLCWAAPALADYIFVLKNGRQITVQTYHEEDQMMRLSVQRGEIRIGKEQIESIVQSGEVLGRAEILPPAEMVPEETAKVGQRGVGAPSSTPTQEDAEKGVVSQAPKEKVLTPEERLAERRAKEEKEYQNRIAELNDQIKALVNSYTKARRGGREGGINPGICITNCEEFTEAQAADLNSRFKDRLYDPARASGSGEVTFKSYGSFAGAPAKRLESRAYEVKRAPRVSVPLSPYTEKEWKFSKLRREIRRLNEKRDRLIQEMREKGYDSASLFLQ